MYLKLKLCSNFINISKKVYNAISFQVFVQRNKKCQPILKNNISGFPLVHSSPSIEVTVINGYSLLYKVRGSNNDDNGDNVLPPYMLAAHLDVVPVANGTWKIAQPFEGRIIDDVIYGRGALDDKSSVMVSDFEYLVLTVELLSSWSSSEFPRVSATAY
jgi:acetylornithine deacetylase/succinyl-diaminopimelate desuccinylase-like protein